MENFPVLTSVDDLRHNVLQVVNGTKLSENCQDKGICRQGMWQFIPSLFSKGRSSLMHTVSSMFLSNYDENVMMLKAVFVVLRVCKLLSLDPRGSLFYVASCIWGLFTDIDVQVGALLPTLNKITKCYSIYGFLV